MKRKKGQKSPPQKRGSHKKQNAKPNPIQETEAMQAKQEDIQEGSENTAETPEKGFSVSKMLEIVRQRAENGQPPIVNGEREIIKRWDKQRKEIESSVAQAFKKNGVARARTTHRRWQKAFLWHYSRSGNAMCSARAVEIHPSVPAHYAEKHPKFAEAMEQARQEAIEYLELCAWQRATEGTARPVFMKDENGVPRQIGTIQEYSDRLAEFLLSANKPEKYRQNKNQVELSGPGGGPIMQQNAVVIIPSNGRDALEQLKPVALPENTEEKK